MLRSKVAITDKKDILQAIRDSIVDDEEAIKGRAKMREEYRIGHTLFPLSPETTGEAKELYVKIKKLSLFPNIYNNRGLKG